MSISLQIHPRRISLRLHAVRAAVFLVAFSLTASGQLKPTQYDVKAAYLYNFGKFINWPANSTPVFAICVLGKDPFDGALVTTVNREVLNGKSVEVKNISTENAASSCSMVFISASEQGRVATIISVLSKRQVLTVSDIPGFIDKGGMIGFVMEGDRVRFEVNQAAAQNAGLILSSELLRVAVSVKKGVR